MKEKIHSLIISENADDLKIAKELIIASVGDFSLLELNGFAYLVTYFNTDPEWLHRVRLAALKTGKNFKKKAFL